MNIPLLVEYFLVLFGYDFNKKARLEKVEPESQFQQWCDKIAPYLIFFSVIIIGVLLLIVLLKYGHAFSTEANNYEHLQQIIG